MFKAMGGRIFKHWKQHLAEATWLDHTCESISHNGYTQSSSLHNVRGDYFTVVPVKDMLGNMVWVFPASGKGKPLRGTVFAQGPAFTWWVMQKYGDGQCISQSILLQKIKRVNETFSQRKAFQFITPSQHCLLEVSQNNN